MSWYRIGREAKERIKREKEKKEKRKEDREKWYLHPYVRIWMRPGQKLTCTFVDDNHHPEGYDWPYEVCEHQVKINNNWENITCTKGMKVKDYYQILGTKDPYVLKSEGIIDDINNFSDNDSVGCVLCERSFYSFSIVPNTVIDHEGWVDKEGIQHSDVLKLLVVKNLGYSHLESQREKRGGLRGCRFEIERMTPDSPNTGDKFDFEGKIELPDDIQPAPYNEVFKPKTPRELIELIGNRRGVSKFNKKNKNENQKNNQGNYSNTSNTNYSSISNNDKDIIPF